MIRHPAFDVDPWTIRENRLLLDMLAQTESVFALSNGHIGLRGNLDEGEPCGLPGTYLNSVCELRPLPYAEAGFGFPESGETVINITNGKLIRLLVDDQPLDIRYGDVHTHERFIDLREGVLQRNLRWTSASGRTVRLHSERMVSFTQRAVAAISYEVEPVDESIRVVVQSELVANETLPPADLDPRTAAVLDAPLEGEHHHASERGALLQHITRRSRLRVAAGMDHVIEGPAAMHVESNSTADVARLTVTADLKPGERLRIVKFIAYGWSSQRSPSALYDQIVAALAAARFVGWEGLIAEQRAYLDAFWAQADVEIDGDPEIQQAVRFALFHVLQAGSRGERRPIPAKGLTGPGYDGHVFWDTEAFVLPLLTAMLPRAAADALRWRQSTIDLARQRALQLGLRGAAFPWRTIRGHECSGYWPAGTAAFHVNAAIADAALRYVSATEDAEFEEQTALELLVETARLWHSLGHYDASGRFRIDGVTGPDEYSAIADNNVYTNLMAQQNLRGAADVAERYPAKAATLGVAGNEPGAWRDAAGAVLIPYDERLGAHPQAESFTDHERWDFAGTAPDHYPLFLHFPYFDLYRKQVVKQADLVLAMHRRGDAFTPDEKQRNFAYYEAITVRDSSLSAATQAVIAAEVGQIGLAYDYLGETALMDLDDLERNTRDGIHIASLAGSWSVLVEGFGGMRMRGGTLHFAPRLPDAITRLRFQMLFRGRLVCVEALSTSVTYQLLDGEALTIAHHGVPQELTRSAPVTLAIPSTSSGPPPTQPSGRAPAPRGRAS